MKYVDKSLNVPKEIDSEGAYVISVCVSKMIQKKSLMKFCGKVGTKERNRQLHIYPEKGIVLFLNPVMELSQ